MTPEGKVKKYIASRCNRLGGLFRFIQYINMSGAPDCFCLLPGNRFIFIEAKQLYGKLSEIQKYEITAFGKRGHKVEVPYTEEDVDRIFDAIPT